MRLALAFSLVAASTSSWMSGIADAADKDASAIDLLRNMHNSARVLNYQGTFVYMHDGKVESMQIFHRNDNKSERERVVHLNGSPREIIREGNVVTCILSDVKAVRITKLESAQHILSALPANFTDFKQYYAFSIIGQDRVAGRSALIVAVEPKDMFRYGYRFWLDAEHALMLKSQMLGKDGEPIEQLMFTALDVVSDIPMSSLKPAFKGAHMTLTDGKGEEKEMDLQASTAWQFVKMPDGFKPTGHNTRQLESGGGPVQHFVLSDGLASVSVYIEKLNLGKKQFIGASYMGAVNVHGTIINTHQVTVVGEVPAATVKMVAESIQYTK